MSSWAHAELRYGSVCSGIEAATVAWHPLGWQAAWYAEIEPFPCAVLAHYYPDVPNLGDMTTIAARITAGDVEAPDVLTGGTPCQAFSVAGLRGGLHDERGQLSLEFCRLADAIDAIRLARGAGSSLVMWENVPGVLSSQDNAFGCFLAGLAGECDPLQPPGGRWTDAGCVYGPQRTVAWRILDAQYFGLAQRRRRVFVVAGSTDGPDPCQILFEREGLRRDTTPSREAGQGFAADIAPCLRARSNDSHREDTEAHVAVTGPICANGKAAGSATLQDAEGGMLVYGGNNRGGAIKVAPALNAKGGSGRMDFESEALCVTGHQTHALTSEGYDASEDGTGRGTPIIGFPAEMSGTQVAAAEDLSPALSVKHNTAIAFDTTQITSDKNYSHPKDGDPCHPLAAGAHAPAVIYGIDQEHNVHDDLFGTLQRKGSGGFEGTVATLAIRGRGGHQNLEVRKDGTANAILTPNGSRGGIGVGAIHHGMRVRRLTPIECERLQGFPDDYTASIPHAPVAASGQAKARKLMEAGDHKFTDINGTIWKVSHADGPRYRALGNSWAVPCAAWIGRRIQQTIANTEAPNTSHMKRPAVTR